MAVSCFSDRSVVPNDAMVKAALGRAWSRWEKVTAYLLERRPGIRFVWKMPAAKYGWSARAVDGKRNLIYLIPQQGRMLVAVVLGDRAVAAAQSAGLPEHVLEALNSSRRYAEGTGIRLEVKSLKDIKWIKQLVELKLAY